MSAEPSMEAHASAKCWAGKKIRPEATLKATCPQCGNVYMEDALFCRKCGHKRGEQARL